MEGSSSSNNSDAGEPKSGCGCSGAAVNNNNDATAAAATAAAAVAAAAAKRAAGEANIIARAIAAEKRLYQESMKVKHEDQQQQQQPTDDHQTTAAAVSGSSSSSLAGGSSAANINLGPGAAAAFAAFEASEITITVSPTTGGQFDLSVFKTDSVESLKKVISKRLRVPKERICLLYREKQLRDGSLDDNQLMQGSRLTLLPSVETGLLVQRPEQSVMQALESLNDSQVNDFLSGKAPLNLTMRLGDHMMLIQLQLSTVSSSGSSKRLQTAASTVASTGTAASALSASTVAPEPPPQATATAATACSAGNIIGTPRLIPGVDAYPITRVRNVSDDSDDNSMDTTEDAPPERSMTPPTPAPAPVEQAAPAATPPAPATASCSCDASTSTASTTTAAAAGDKPQLDTRALAEASRNLTQTLKQLSSEVLTTKSGSKEMHIGFKRRPGAIIESMQHHGKGVYSGTFSGTLNPALQDRFGRPKRDISTIIHILNDLLCATPQYRAAARSGTPAVCTATTLPPTTSAAQAAAPFTTANGVSAQTSANSDNTESETKENAATRGKMERLRLIMEEKRERRRASRSVPYDKSKSGTQWSAKSETQSVAPQDPPADPTLPPEQVVV
ncbi:Ubiquitin-related domain,Ubiquitin domain [Cinara cedri]|uniref:Ubiquitin-related domain,Ubiquitin domain n=1 Tax=Cinara cedri TaxID=506608 RepID=A0A5E4M1G0_9HEMI|nr:Ubiquitin-related domain,Ubiquitin domain [Cinara cedri]